MALKSPKIFLTLLLIMPITISTLSAATPSFEESPYLRRAGRFLADAPRAQTTCDKNPRICRTKGSAGPYCCNKQCVNVLTDKLNCGKCGRKCSYSEMCCQGYCVNPSRDENNCGKCNKRCKKGSSCVYGLCSYA